MNETGLTLPILMKLFAFILSIFIAGQAFVPCTDGNTCDESIEQTAEHDHSNDEGDRCTQFCVCSCCGSIFTVTAYSILKEFSPPPISVALPVIEDAYAFRYDGAIWRPPTFS